jgi:hypothetical protein
MKTEHKIGAVLGTVRIFDAGFRPECVANNLLKRDVVQINRFVTDIFDNNIILLLAR